MRGAEALAPPRALRRRFPGWRFLAGIGAGAALALGQAPFALLPVALAGLIAAFLLWRGTAGAWAAARLGWAVGLGHFGLALVWIVEPFLVDAARHGWMAPIALTGLAGGLAMLWAAAFALARWLAPPHARRPLAAVALALCWAGAELARAYVLTGFPWALPAYLWLGYGLDQGAALIGPHGLTLFTLLIGAATAAALEARRPLAALGGLALVIGGLALLGLSRAAPAPEMAGRPVIRLVQPNAEQRLKWDPEMVPVFFRRQIAFTAAPPRDPAAPRPALTIWPETAVPYAVESGGDVAQIVSEAAGGRPVALGGLREAGGSLRNSLFLITEGGEIAAIYDKHHLVPFGEYVPFADTARRIGLEALVAQGGRFAPGPGARLIDVPGLGSALPLICYEAIFPQDVNAAPARARFLLQITNDAWFGTFSGPWQHLAQARFRAIEQGLPMLRAANTGISAVIGPHGRILAEIPLGVADFIDAPLPAALPPTPYSRTGDLPVALLIGAGLLLLLSARLRKSPRKSN